jgi:hypothetical protein
MLQVVGAPQVSHLLLLTGKSDVSSFIMAVDIDSINCVITGDNFWAVWQTLGVIYKSNVVLKLIG